MAVSPAPGGPPGPPARRAPRRRPSLYVTVLSLAIAAIAATWLPFSVLYISALSQRSASPAAITTTYAPGASTAHGAAVTTRTSGGTQASTPASTAPAPAATAVTTRAS